MRVSVIIPTFNEETLIGDLVRYIQECCFDDDARLEIIIADGGSTDETVVRACNAGARAVFAETGRARQMNAGAAAATGDVFFFLHADTWPPQSFVADITEAIHNGYQAGCYRLSFDHDHWFLRLNSWFTRFDFTPFRFGDQGLFICKNLFQRIHGFNSRLTLLEDQEIIYRIKERSGFRILDKHVRTSARKYLLNGIFKLQSIFVMIYFLYRLGLPQHRLMRLYTRLIRDEKHNLRPLRMESVCGARFLCIESKASRRKHEK